MDGGSDGQARGQSFLLSGRMAGVKLTDRHRLETVHGQCGTSSLQLMVHRPFSEWMRIACHGRPLIAH
eukprot:365978-Chlamydomonas_euryale.AAC.11